MTFKVNFENGESASPEKEDTIDKLIFQIVFYATLFTIMIVVYRPSLSSFVEKLQLLIWCLWTSEKTIGTLPATTQYMVRQSRRLINLDLVKSFYCSDEISRMMPGQKNFVSKFLVQAAERSRGW